jgi:hypothetical protein
VDRRLSADSVVVLDSLNYIKGFRYELYCSARTFRTPHCVVWVAAGDGLGLGDRRAGHLGEGFGIHGCRPFARDGPVLFRAGAEGGGGGAGPAVGRSGARTGAGWVTKAQVRLS